MTAFLPGSRFLQGFAFALILLVAGPVRVSDSFALSGDASWCQVSAAVSAAEVPAELGADQLRPQIYPDTFFEFSVVAPARLVNKSVTMAFCRASTAVKVRTPQNLNRYLVLRL